MSEVISPKVEKERLPEIVWGGEKVITTEVLAGLYQAKPKHLQDNFQNNRSRFTEGKHFFRLEGADLKGFKSDRPDLVGSVVGARAKALMLWTERGAMRHAKALETEAAWEVFETLEETYFSVREAANAKTALSTVWDRYPLYGFAIDTVLRHHLMFSKVYLLLNLFAGSRRFKDMTKEQVSEVIDFCDRFAVSQDTRADWRRIQENQVKLHGEQRQLDMVQQLLIR